MAKAIKKTETAVEETTPIVEETITDKIDEPIVSVEPVIETPAPPVKAKKEEVKEPEEMSFIRKVAYTQHHGGRGAYLNELLIERAKVVLGISNVFIENGEIIT